MTKMHLAIVTLTGLLAACGETTEPVDPVDPVDPVPIARIEVAAPFTTLAPDATLQLTATAFDADGEVLTGRAFVWTSSDASVALVSATGLVTARDPGEVMIAATAEGETGAATLTVDTVAPAAVASIEIEPGGEVILDREAWVLLTAIVRDAGGEILDGREVAWATDDALVATVSEAGVVTALAEGEASITATCEGLTAEVQIRVPGVPVPVAWIELAPGDPVTLPAGELRQLAVIAHAADGAILVGRPVTWSSDATTVATVSDTGLVETVADGSAHITAEVEGQTAQAAITVSTVTHVTLHLGEAVILVGDQLQLFAFPRDAANLPVDRPVSWSSDAPGIAFVDDLGILGGAATGLAHITATSDGKSATMLVSVLDSATHVLTTIDDVALPADLYSIVEVDANGVARTVRFEITDGSLRVRHTDPRYELTLWGLVHRDGFAPVLSSYESIGDVAWDPVTEGTHYQPDEAAMPSFHGWLQPDGSQRIVLQIDENLPAATLVFIPE